MKVFVLRCKDLPVDPRGSGSLLPHHGQPRDPGHWRCVGGGGGQRGQRHGHCHHQQPLRPQDGPGGC